MNSCIFCKIIEKKIPATIVYENDKVICIQDIHPQANIHTLVIPKLHLNTLEDAYPENGPSQNELLGHLMGIVVRVARLQGLLPGGFRTIINTGHDGGQTAFHLHVHVLGGGKLKEKMI